MENDTDRYEIMGSATKRRRARDEEARGIHIDDN